MFKFPLTRCAITADDRLVCNTGGDPVLVHNSDGSHNHDQSWSLYHLPAHSTGAEFDFSLCGQDPACHFKLDPGPSYQELKEFNDSIPPIPTTHEHKFATMPNGAHIPQTKIDKW
jgi:hypothetical protein